MPQVPKYGLPKIDSTPLPAARQDARNQQEGAIAWSRTMQDVGDATLRLATFMKDKALKERFEAFQTESMRGFDQIQQVRLMSPDFGQDGSKGLLNQRGRAVNEHVNVMMEQAELEADELGKGAKSTEERLWFGRFKQDRLATMRGLAVRHGSEQMQVYLSEENAAAQASAMARGIQAAPYGILGEQEIDVVVSELAGLVSAQSARDGDSEKEATRKFELARAELYAGATIEMLLKRQVPQALAFWKRVSPYVTDNAMRQRVMQATESANVDHQALEVSQAAWKQFKPADQTGEIDDDAAHSFVTSALKDNPQALRAALTLLDDSIQTWRRARNAQQNKLVGPLLEAITDGASPTDIISRPEYQALLGENKTLVWDRVTNAAAERQRAAEHVVDRRFQLEEREKDRAYQDRRRAQEMAAEANMRAYAILTDPNTLRLIPADQRTNFFARAQDALPGAPDLVKQAMTAFDAAHPEARPDTTPAAVVVSDELLRATFGESGYPWAKSGTRNSWKPEQQALFGRVASQADIEIDRAQRAPGNNNKPLDEAAKKEIVKRILETKVQVRGWIGVGLTDKNALEIDVKDRSGEMKRIQLPIATAETKYPILLRTTLAKLREVGRARQSTGRTTVDRGPVVGTDDTLKREYRDRIEWAMALILSGATEAEATEVLRSGFLPPAQGGR